MTNSNILDRVPYNELETAYKALEKRNKDIVDGLYYAAFVQQGLMPQQRHFEALRKPYFVYYNPLQIIGGDFFWIGKREEWLYYAVGDCTGHGVSGAMLSSLAIGFLNYIIYSKNFWSTGEIASELDKKWIETFNYHEQVDVNNDWLELTIAAHNQNTGVLQLTSAGGTALISSNGTLEKRKGNPYPIGGWQIEKNRRFDTQLLNISGVTSVYLYSDGFKDQFGGLSGKRLGSSRFQQILSNSSSLSCEDQKAHIENFFDTWKGTCGQTDDVCVLRIDLA
jgi:serine phosphatase RsbU (regulator of sigma subunit)